MYQQKEYEQAATKLLSLVDDGYTNASVHYNLGNAFYRQNEIGKAILHFEKALKINPDHADAAHNLKIANKRVADKFNAVPTPPLRQIFIDVSNVLNTDAWAIIGVAFALLAAICFGDRKSTRLNSSHLIR